MEFESIHKVWQPFSVPTSWLYSLKFSIAKIQNKTEGNNTNNNKTIIKQ